VIERTRLARRFAPPPRTAGCCKPSASMYRCSSRRLRRGRRPGRARGVLARRSSSCRRRWELTGDRGVRGRGDRRHGVHSRAVVSGLSSVSSRVSRKSSTPRRPTSSSSSSWPCVDISTGRSVRQGMTECEARRLRTPRCACSPSPFHHRNLPHIHDEAALLRHVRLCVQFAARIQRHAVVRACGFLRIGRLRDRVAGHRPSVGTLPAILAGVGSQRSWVVIG